MPSPFPGMDPYLEEPDLWPDVHAELIAQIRAELNPQLRPNYVARIEQRVFVSDDADAARDLIVPDVRVVAGGQRGRRPPVGAAPTRTGMPAATIEPVDVISDVVEEGRQRFIRVTDVRDRSVVAVIEVLSPSNKSRGSAGRESYLDKRHEVMSSPAHWIEIDLLRAGTRMVVREPLPPHDYLVHVSRAPVAEGDRRAAKVWPIPLAHPLPTIPIPLRHGDPDVTVDLQAVLDRAYERGAYDVDVDYAADPAPPLADAAAEWAQVVVAAWLNAPSPE